MLSALIASIKTKTNLFSRVFPSIKSGELVAQRPRLRNMDCPELMPPSTIRGMTVLDREKFKKIIKVPKLNVTEVSLNSVLPHIKPVMLKMGTGFKSVETTADGIKKVILHPLAISCFGELPEEIRNLGLNGSHLIWEDYELNYANWKADEILKAILPADQDPCTSFSRIGHIIHVNLRDHLIPYKKLIGEVLRDKIAGIRCVINKTQTIDSTFRNFKLELLCGEADYQVKVKENGITYEFDFSQVYWNPRLSTEHERIIKLHKEGDVLYDVFAGVGPFSVPVAKRKAHVLANDLNPMSFKWLEHNAKKNKVSKYLATFNKDGREFIKVDVKADLIKRWSSKEATKKDYNIHLTMNLPAMAVEFLDTFCGLMLDYNGPVPSNFPLVHVYCFAKGDDSSQTARQMAEENLGFKFGSNLQGVHFVRNVAQNKDMFRVSFYLTREILFSKKLANKRSIAPEINTDLNCKKQCN